MEYAVLMEVNERLEDLVEEALGLVLWKWLVAIFSHILFQVKFDILEHKVQLLL